MPKPKAFLKNKQKGKKAELKLDTADDYQAAGVELEEAAGKHRAGDAVKSLRFFERAITTYDEGLHKFPTSFDLAYNKARVQYEVATHPKLAPQLQHAPITLLRSALASHEHALKLNDTDADLLFNTAQVLTSIAEHLANDGATGDAIGLLQSALELQARCLSEQERRYAETLQQQSEAREFFARNTTANDDTPPQPQGSMNSPSADTDTDSDGQWASVVEPVTASTLLDTIAACFATMTTLVTTFGASGSPPPADFLSETEHQHAHLVSKIQALASSEAETMHEIALADAILQSATLDLSFTSTSMPRAELLDEAATAYATALSRVWDPSNAHLQLNSSADALIAHANACIAFNYALATKSSDSDTTANSSSTSSSSSSSIPSDTIPTSPSPLRWTSLTAAHTSLSTASTLPSISPSEKASTHFLRGDVSLLLYRVASTTVESKYAKEAPTLLRNAEVFYRNAAKLLGTDGRENQERARFRSVVAREIGEGGGEVVFSGGGGGGGGGGIFDGVFAVEEKEKGKGEDRERRIVEELQEMVEEGLLLERVGGDGRVVYI